MVFKFVLPETTHCNILPKFIKAQVLALTHQQLLAQFRLAILDRCAAIRNAPIDFEQILATVGVQPLPAGIWLANCGGH